MHSIVRLVNGNMTPSVLRPFSLVRVCQLITRPVLGALFSEDSVLASLSCASVCSGLQAAKCSVAAKTRTCTRVLLYHIWCAWACLLCVLSSCGVVSRPFCMLLSAFVTNHVLFYVRLPPYSPNTGCKAASCLVVFLKAVPSRNRTQADCCTTFAVLSSICMTGVSYIET